MVTGIETAGLVLAVLPLLVKQVDDYAKGLSTIRSFGARKYRREMNLYAAELGNQAALLTDSVMLLIEDIVDDAESFSVSPYQSLPPLFLQEKTQARLQKRLGRNFDRYLKTMQALSDNLMELQTKLGLEADAVQKGTFPASNQDVFLRNVKKFRDVFNKFEYDELLSRLDRANSCLKTLTENALREEKSSEQRRHQKLPLQHYRLARKYAKTLHKAFLEKSCLGCVNTHSHKLKFCVEQDDFSSILEGESPNIVFNMMLLSQMTGNTPAVVTGWSGKELRIVPAKLDPISSKALLNMPSHQIQNTKLNPHKKVAFALAIAPAVAIPWQTIVASSVDLSKQDICSKLMKPSTIPQECLGFFGEDICKDHRHDVYLVRDLPTSPTSRSLLETLVEAQKAPLWQTNRHSLKLWTNRLRVAVVLALGGMKFHGTWLRPFWKLKDMIVLDKVTSQSQTKVLQRLYLEWDINQPLNLSNLSLSQGSPLIRSDLLFPLGLALIELALCESMETLRMPEDADPVEAVALLKAALRLVDNDIISLHCGQRYGDVVRDCLLWPGRKNIDLEDANEQQMVWERIALPLIEDLRAAEGKTGT